MYASTPVNNTHYTLFNDALQEIPASYSGTFEHLVHLEARIAIETDGHTRMTQLREAANMRRVLGDLDRADSHANAALAASNDLRDKQARILNLLSLARIQQARGDYLLADRICEQIILACEARYDAAQPGVRNSMAAFLDQAYHCYGLSHYHQGNYVLARLYFERALILRCNQDDEAIIQESIHALAITHTQLQRVERSN